MATYRPLILLLVFLFWFLMSGPGSLGNLTGFEGIRSFEIRQNIVLRRHRPLEGMAEPWKTKHDHKVSRLKLSSRYREDLSGSLGQWGQDGGFQLPIFAGMISLRATSCILLVPVLLPYNWKQFLALPWYCLYLFHFTWFCPVIKN